MTQTDKKRLQDILQHKIDFYEERRLNFIKKGISINKIEKMEILRDKFTAQKGIVDAS